MDALVKASCLPCQEVVLLSTEAIDRFLVLFERWALEDEGRCIVRTFRLSSFTDTVTFVNAVFWLANDQQHHPHLEVAYDACTVRWTTHSVSGLSRNDFICAAKVEVLRDASEVD